MIGEVEDFLATTGVAATVLAQRATVDPGFIRQLRAGRRARPALAAQVRAFMAAYRAERA